MRVRTSVSLININGSIVIFATLIIMHGRGSRRHVINRAFTGSHAHTCTALCVRCTALCVRRERELDRGCIAVSCVLYECRLEF